MVSNYSSDAVLENTKNTDAIEAILDSSDQALDSFMALVGRRVREHRVQRGWSGRKLSEVSSVSLRYLSLLENGKGNASTAVLFKLAKAFDCPVEQLVTEDLSTDPSNQHLLKQFESSSPEIQLKVCEILNTSGRISTKARRVCLVGLSGAGKTSLGRLLADRVGVPFLDLEAEVEKTAGMSVQEVIHFYGQDSFQKIQKKALESLVENHEAAVLSVPGDVVKSTDNYRYVLRKFNTIWLKASPEEHMSRKRLIGQTRSDAAREQPGSITELRALLSHREALFANADQMLNTSGRSVQQSLLELYDVSYRYFAE